jgi:(1->4)-alpha-D-glucan 1-alpha-D-glucosylmutase
MTDINFSEDMIQSFVAEKTRSLYAPSAVYRVQLNKSFNFRQAKALIPYFKDLGVEALYCSPYFQAMPGSVHGYDVTDPTKINREVGSMEDHEQFCKTLTDNGMGQIMDVVPNHMGILGNNNPWWQDVLENGKASMYADFFDIDWEPVKNELKNKVLLPVLGDHYGALLEDQQIKLVQNEGSFWIHYFDHHFPVDPGEYPFILELGINELQKTLPPDDGGLLQYLSIITAFKNLPPKTERDPQRRMERNREKEIAKKRLAALFEVSNSMLSFVNERVRIFNGQKGDRKSFDLIDELLNRQAYRLAFWRVATEEINYRRFFDINSLAAIRMEDWQVFHAHHHLLFDLLVAGKVQGLRIDHPDGLYDPTAYFNRLQVQYLYRLFIKEHNLPEDPGENNPIRIMISKALKEDLPLLVVTEKILDRTEQLPENWQVHGTVGYDYLNALNGLFADKNNEEEFTQIYEDFIGRKTNFGELVYSKKKVFALVQMASEINSLGHRLDRISEQDRRYRDFTRNNLTVAIREVIACFRVYRTYISPGDEFVSDRDVKYITMAVERAKQKTPSLNPAVFDFLRDILLLKLDRDIPEQDKELYHDFVLRFQQLTAPIMAKGEEDTAFYVYNRLLSLNEVGGNPFHFGYTVQEFHQKNLERCKQWPLSMVTTSTHDTKRSKDLRMRLHVLSEIPEEWKQKLKIWPVINEKFKTMINDNLEPGTNTEYFIYQILLGVWPPALKGLPSPELVERLWQYFLKSIREAKNNTEWRQPNLKYEDAVKKFVQGILSCKEFVDDLTVFQQKTAFYGALNTLSALTIKIASPGIVDVYQGNELFDYRLVDPDNRMPVDFSQRQGLLEQLKSGFKPSHYQDDRTKLYITWKGLNFRHQNAELFLQGEYIPLEVTGAKARHVIAFLRRHNGKMAVVVAGRFFTKLVGQGEVLDPNIWEDTTIAFPHDASDSALTNVFNGKQVEFAKGRLIKVADILDSCGFALLARV